MTFKVAAAPPFAIVPLLAHCIALYFFAQADKDAKLAEREKKEEYESKKRKSSAQHELYNEARTGWG